MSIYFILMIISSAAAASQHQKIASRSYVILAALVLWAAGFFAVSQATSALVIAASIVLFGVGQGFIMSTVTEWIDRKVPILSEGTPDKARTFTYMGQFVAPLVFCPAVVLGLNIVFLAASGTCAVLLIFLAFIGKNLL
jgi:ACDE family multidrug resistance protein